MEARAADLTKNTYNKAWADKTYAEKLQASLGLEPGMDSPADGGGNVDIDYIKYIQAAGITDTFAQTQILNFILGAKALGIWNNIVCWPLRLNQNIKAGNTVYSLGGFGSYPGTLINNPTRELNGIYFQTTNQQGISTTLGANLTAGSNYGLFCCADLSQITSTAGNVIVAGGPRDIFNSGTTQTGSPSIVIGATSPTNVRFIADPTYNPSPNFGASQVYNGTAPTSGFATFSALSNGTNIVFSQNQTTLFTTVTTVPTPLGDNISIGYTQYNQKYFNGRIQFVLAAFCPVDNTALYNLYMTTLGSGELDAPAYFARAGVTDPTAQSQITQFVTGIKNKGIWYRSIFWPLIRSQNRGTGNIVYGLGGLGVYDGTLVNGSTWGLSGITFNGTNQYISTTVSPNISSYSDFGIMACADFTTVSTTSATGAPIIANRDLYNNDGFAPAVEQGIALGFGTPYTNYRINVQLSQVSADTRLYPGINFASALSNGTGTVFSDNTTTIGTATKVVSASNLANVSIGAGPGADGSTIGEYFPGNISFAGVVYNTLDHSYIYNLYKSTLGSSFNLP